MRATGLSAGPLWLQLQLQHRTREQQADPNVVRRGASSIGARTSWTSKPEQADYMSVVGFMAYYAHYIDSSHRGGAGSSVAPVLLQAGYSYGAMVTTKLPPLSDVLAPFEGPAVHSAAADIRLRAQHLAEQQYLLSASPASPRRSMGLRVGGDEDVTRKSHDISRPHTLDPEDKIRKGVKELLARTKRVHRNRRHKSSEDAGEVVHEEECMVKLDGLQHYRSAYLLVSPPIGFMTNLATMSFANLFTSGPKKNGRSDHCATNTDGAAGAASELPDSKFSRNSTLVIHGDQDGFIAHRKARDWATMLKSHQPSQFQHIVVARAGHFWAEEGTARQLRDAVGAFGTGLLGSSTHSLQPWDGT